MCICVETLKTFFLYLQNYIYLETFLVTHCNVFTTLEQLRLTPLCHWRKIPKMNDETKLLLQELRVKYEQRVQALVAENERLKASIAPADTSTSTAQWKGEQKTVSNKFDHKILCNFCPKHFMRRRHDDFYFCIEFCSVFYLTILKM